ncbi:15582_t:CDS:2, partial [Funneliformis mosseae]
MKLIPGIISQYRLTFITFISYIGNLDSSTIDDISQVRAASINGNLLKLELEGVSRTKVNNIVLKSEGQLMTLSVNFYMGIVDVNMRSVK